MIEIQARGYDEFLALFLRLRAQGVDVQSAGGNVLRVPEDTPAHLLPGAPQAEPPNTDGDADQTSQQQQVVAPGEFSADSEAATAGTLEPTPRARTKRATTRKPRSRKPKTEE